MITTTQIKIDQTNKSFSSLQGKSRLDSLMERIQSANKEISTILEKPILPKKAEKIQKKKDDSTEDKPLQTLNQKITENDNNNKSIQVGLDDMENNQENIENNNNNENINKEDNKDDNVNQETQVVNNIDNQEQKEQKEQESNINDLKPEIPFVKRVKTIINELKIMKEKAGIKEEDINKDISELPKRAIVEMSLSDFKIKKKYESIKKELEEKNNYIIKLENEIVNQRIINNNLKKSEGEHLLKISALEDELRVMKLKFLGHNTSEEFNIHNHQQYNTDPNNCGHIYGEQLVHSNWIKDTKTPNAYNNMNHFDLDNSRPLLNKGERWRAPWISQSHGTFNRMIMRNLNKNLINNPNENPITRTDNRYSYEISEKNNFVNNNNNRFENFKSNNINNHNLFNGGNNNFQRVSGMILDNSNKMKLTKNYSNDFNRFRIGNNNINNNNNNNNIMNNNNSYFK